MTTTETSTIEDLLTTYASRAEPVGVKVERVASSQEACAWLASLRPELEAPELAISAELIEAAPLLKSALDGAGVSWSTPADLDTVKDAPFGVSIAKLAVAETGSILLAEASLTARAVGLLSLAHVTVCRTDDLVPKLEDAAIALREIASQPNGGYATLVTGPSRTADIEMSLTVGVQGPARVWVLFVDNLT
jgi:L-lactate dehydrogenase complex protein LldG